MSGHPADLPSKEACGIPIKAFDPPNPHRETLSRAEESHLRTLLIWNEPSSGSLS